MLASVQSMGLMGIQGYPVTVEAYCTDGMPMFELVGLPDAAVKESRERVRAALSACQMTFPVARLTLNLAPADVRKEGPAYDLPIALAILASTGVIDGESMQGMAAVGELSLSGSVMGVRGALSMAIAAREHGLHTIMLPAQNAAEAACIEGLSVLPVAPSERRDPTICGERKPSSRCMRGRMRRYSANERPDVILPMCAGRRAPSVRWKSRRRADTTC